MFDIRGCLWEKEYSVKNKVVINDVESIGWDEI